MPIHCDFVFSEAPKPRVAQLTGHLAGRQAGRHAGVAADSGQGYTTLVVISPSDLVEQLPI